MTRHLASALAVVVLLAAGCQHVTQTNGDETISATSLFTNINVASDCSQYDPDGNLLSTTHHTLTTSGDAATLHEAGTIFTSALEAVLAKGATGGAGMREGAVPSPPGSPAVTGCSGEKTSSTRPPPAGPPSPTASAAPYPDPFGAWHAADGPGTPVAFEGYLRVRGRATGGAG